MLCLKRYFFIITLLLSIAILIPKTHANGNDFDLEQAVVVGEKDPAQVMREMISFLIINPTYWVAGIFSNPALFDMFSRFGAFGKSYMDD